MSTSDESLVIKQCPSDDSPNDSNELSPLLAALSAVAVLGLSAAYVLFRNHRKRQDPPSRSSSAPSTHAAISALARLWLAQDPDPTTCEELRSQLHQISTRDDSHLRDRLAVALDPVNRIRFGTAGVRAEVGLGYDRLNIMNVIAVAQGVLAMLRKNGALAKGIVVGYDARYDSERFAICIATVFDCAGVPVWLFAQPVPTPFVAFATLQLGCDTAFCVTASHNPPRDNGVKVFGRDGIQIRPTEANLTENSIRENSRPWRSYPSFERSTLSENVKDPTSRIEEPYYQTMTSKLRRRSYDENAKTEPVVYTACHGIGYKYIEKMFKSFGLPNVVPCEAQCEPDPAFPTLPFPNPEEQGALDLAIETARSCGARLVIANDPDADRLGACEMKGKGATARIFSGNEIAILLCDYLSSAHESVDMSKYAVVASAVSSKICASMAKTRGFEFHEALTGFKWLNKTAVDLEAAGKIVLLCYEEALGFNVTQNEVRDKDGVSAAAVLSEMAGALYESGNTLTNRLEQLMDECGVHLSKNGYLKTSEKGSNTSEVFDKARARGFPDHLGDAKVKSIRDLTKGTDTAEGDGKARLPSDPRSQFVTFRCGGMTSAPSDEVPLIIHLRGSGTGTYTTASTAKEAVMACT